MARRNRSRPERRRPKIIVPIASMGDIAFLLIIFFMIASQMASDPMVPVDQATSEDIDQLDDAPQIVVTVTGDGLLYLNREVVDNVDLLEAGVAALIEGAQTEPQRTVTFKADAAVSQEVFMPAWQALVKANARIAAVGERAAPGGRN